MGWLKKFEKKMRGTYADVDAALARHTANEKVGCFKGCASCCHFDVATNDAEVNMIVLAIQAMPADQQQAVEKRIREVHNVHVHGVRDWGRFAAKVPCPLIDEEAGACTVYDVRPLACRGYMARSSGACVAGFASATTSEILASALTIAHAARLQVSVAMKCTEGELTDMLFDRLEDHP